MYNIAKFLIAVACFHASIAFLLHWAGLIELGDFESAVWISMCGSSIILGIFSSFELYQKYNSEDDSDP